MTGGHEAAPGQGDAHSDAQDTQPSWTQIRQAFDRAADLPPTERGAFLAHAYPPLVAAKVTSLLAHHEEATQFLAPPLVSPATDNALPRGHRHRGLEDLSGRELAGRYTLGELIGHGGSASVYEALDTVSRETVALKIRRAAATGHFDLIRSEATALRLLRLPGVVEMRDEGTADGLSFLVMERIHGRPFPSREGPLPWSALRQATLALLETVARIHWTGVSHCDLKPSNVLVREDGAPIVLDLGVAQDPGLSEAARRALALARTPRYTSPEQLVGEPGTARSDLFSIGVMLYEALTGRDPHDARNTPELLSFRPHILPPAIRSMAPDVPEYVAQVIDQLVSTTPSARPTSAAEALAGLNRSPRASAEVPGPLGSSEMTERIVSACARGKAIDIHGGRGSGRTSSLKSAAQMLEREGREVLWARASTRPFGSLAPLLRPPFAVHAGSADEARLEVLCALRTLLASGVVFIADDAEQLDTYSADALEASREHGAVVRAYLEPRGASSPVPPLSEREIAAVFRGYERIHHIPSDAARELRERTSGRPGAVLKELAAWERAGLVRPEGGQFVIGRASLARLRSGLNVRMGEAVPTEVQDVDRADLTACVDLLGPHADLARCAEVLESPPWQIESLGRELVGAGHLHRVGQSGLRCTRPTQGGAHWSAERRQHLHARMAEALPPSEPVRLYHRLMAGQHARVAGESLPIAKALLAEGNPVEACAALNEGIRALRHAHTFDPEDTLLALLFRASLQVGTTAALDRLSYLLGRAQEPASPIIIRLKRAAHAAHRAMQGDARGALEVLPALGSLPLDEASLGTLSVRLFVARQLAPDEAEAVIDEATAHVAADPAQQISGQLLAARAWLAYARDEYAEAARLHGEALATALTPLTKLSALLNCASAWLEAGEYASALGMATRARDEAGKGRHAHYEARAERILRAVAYRSGQATKPDTELIAAAADLGVPYLEALICLNEAAVAWRSGRRLLCTELAERAAVISRKSNHSVSLLLARALLVAAGEPTSSEALGRLCEEAKSCEDAAIAVQSAYLLSLAPSTWQEALRSLAATRARETDPKTWETRLEVVSIAEAVR